MQTVRLALEWFVNPDHVPLMVGQAKGWFAEAGIDLQLIEPREHFDAFAEMQAGRVDIAVTEPIHLAQDRLKGEGLVGFARFLHTNGGVMYLRGQGVQRPRDMAGLRVQYPGAPGPGGPAIVRTMIEADGGPADAPLEPVNNGFFHTDALAGGKADLATLVFYNFEVVEARHRGLDADFFALKDWGVPDFCQLILVAPEALLSARRDTLEALITVLRRGIDFVHQHPDEARGIFLEHTGQAADDVLGAEIFRATVGCFTHDLTMSHDYYRHLHRWLIRSGQAPEGEADVRAWWTNELAL